VSKTVGRLIQILVVAILGVSLALMHTQAQEAAPEQNALPLPIDRGAAAVWQSLKKLHTRASLMMVTAHPDDEDGAVLAYESRGVGSRVVLLTLTRGETGANVMSPDYFDALGLVRTQELLAADRYYGAQQYFTRVIDYGFSKTKEEALEQWSHDRVLADVVRIVRLTRPLVITSVFVGGITDGHGNHQVAGQMAQEAFLAAGDPSKFPDQIQAGLRPWKPLKVYARVPFTGRMSEKGLYDYATHTWHPARLFDYVRQQWLPVPLAANVEVPVGDYDPVLGLNYSQISREGLGHQKSQNGGTGMPPAGAATRSYHRFGSVFPATEKENTFFDGIDVSLMGIVALAPSGDTAFLKRGLGEINGIVEQAMAEFNAAHPESIAPRLAAGLKATTALIDQVKASSLPADARQDIVYELEVKRTQFNEAIAQALGISLLATVAPEKEPSGMAAMLGMTPESFQVAIPGQQFYVKVHVVNQSKNPVELKDVSLKAPEGEDWAIERQGPAGGALANNQPSDIRFRVHVPGNAHFTRPYFTRPNIEQPYYDIQDPKYLGQPLPPYPLAARVELNYEGQPIEVSQVVQTVKRVTGAGDVLQPLVVGPAVSVTISPSAGVVPLDAKSFRVSATVHSNVKGPAQGVVRLDLPAGWRCLPERAPFATSKDGEDQSVSFEVIPANLRPQPYTIAALATLPGNEYREGYHTAGYQGLLPYNLYRPAVYKTTGVDVKVAKGLNVGYVEGSGDEVPQSLENLGIQVHYLTPLEIATGDLHKYDVILLGVRTYAVREDLRTYNGRLLDYVKNGGVIVVQYNTPEFDHNYGPYPYTMTNDPEEVTDEQSKVEILDPRNPVFTWPNRITEDDFKGWVEERGSKFMSSWDPHYEALLSTNDPGQAPQKGGLLYARYGQGVYIYNAYAFYRQLPEGVPGAYRIFANLVSLPRNPQLRAASAAPGRTAGR